MKWYSFFQPPSGMFMDNVWTPSTKGISGILSNSNPSFAKMVKANTSVVAAGERTADHKLQQIEQIEVDEKI